MIPIIVVILSVVACAPLSAQSDLPSNYRESITAWIEQDNARTKPADAEYAVVDGDITIYTGDLDGDGDDDCVANYGVTYGGNALTDYLAVFINNGGKLSGGYTREVGSTGAVMIDSIAIRNGKILCTTFIWRSDDGYCCPSGKGNVSFVFRDGRIEER